MNCMYNLINYYIATVDLFATKDEKKKEIRRFY